MGWPKRQRRQAGRYALVDDIAFQMPINSEQTPGLMAAYTVDADKAKALLPKNEIHPFRLWNRALLAVLSQNLDFAVPTDNPIRH